MFSKILRKKPQVPFYTLIYTWGYLFQESFPRKFLRTSLDNLSTMYLNDIVADFTTF